MATKVTNGLDLSSQKIVNVADPTADQDAATKKYVDDKGARYKVTLFSSSGSWTVDANAQFVDVYCFGGGYGGNSGRWTSTSGTYYPGGFGGSGGLANHARFAATIFSGSVTVTVGAGGAGGIAVTTTNTTVSGSFGGNSTFGGYLTSGGGSAIGGAGGTGGQPTGTAATAGSKSRLVWNYADKIELSEALATWNTGGTAGAQAQPVGGAGGQPASVLSVAAYGNAGGGGGGAAYLNSTATVLTGGKGGKGGLPSGGGGGGGSANRGATGTKGGDGGDGGDGAVVVVEWLK